ncbi:MAG: hypothetical protein WD934_05405 [Gemmatimonadales bacterium]
MTTSAFDTMEHRLAELLEREPRGPRQNGVFALWLVARAATALVPPDPISAKAHLTRLAELERRLSSLSMPPPLARALRGALGHLADATPTGAALALRQLVAPAQETVGRRAAEALADAAKAAQQATE